MMKLPIAYPITLIGFLTTFFLSCSNESICGNKILNEISNYSKSHNIVVFERTCGATTKTSIQVSVIEASTHLRNEPGNIFVSNGNFVTTSWINDTVIVVKYSKSDTSIFKKENRIGRLQVNYVTE